MSASDPWRPLRYLWRAPLLALHVLVGLPITLALINPLSARIVLRGERLDHRTIRAWSGAMVWIFGFRVRRYGTPDWKPLVISPLPVAPSATGAVQFSDQECAFDLQATLPDGRVVVWPRVNLCEAKVVTLNRSANGQLWVDYR